MKNEKTEIDLAEELDIETGKAIDEYKNKQDWDSLCIRSSNIGVGSYVIHDAYEHNILGAGIIGTMGTVNTVFANNVAVGDYFHGDGGTGTIGTTHINVASDTHLGALNWESRIHINRPITYNIELHPNDDINIIITGSSRGNFNVRDNRENR